MIFVGTFSAGLIANYSESSDLTSVQEMINLLLVENYTSGTGSSQANAFFSDTRTLVGTSEILNLWDSSLSDSLGNTLSFTKIRGLIIKNKATTSGHNLIIKGSALVTASIVINSPLQYLGAGGLFILTSPVDGISIANPGNTTLVLDAGANTISYDLVLWGTV